MSCDSLLGAAFLKLTSSRWKLSLPWNVMCSPAILINGDGQLRQEDCTTDTRVSSLFAPGPACSSAMLSLRTWGLFLSILESRLNLGRLENAQGQLIKSVSRVEFSLISDVSASAVCVALLGCLGESLLKRIHGSISHGWRNSETWGGSSASKLERPSSLVNSAVSLIRSLPSTILKPKVLFILKLESSASGCRSLFSEPTCKSFRTKKWNIWTKNRRKTPKCSWTREKEAEQGSQLFSTYNLNGANLHQWEVPHVKATF